VVAAQIASMTKAIDLPWQLLRRSPRKPRRLSEAKAQSANCLILAKNKMPHDRGTVGEAVYLPGISTVSEAGLHDHACGRSAVLCHQMRRGLAPINPLGAKGCGEAGAIGAPAAVVSAALDALAPLGVTDWICR
jgi:hypothetical protein